MGNEKKSFTLVEVVVVVVIIGICVTLGIPLYQNVIQDSRAKVCKSNLKVLKSALDIYLVDYSSLPVSLSQLPSRYIREAYQRTITGKDGWQIELAYFITGWREHGIAHASFLMDNLSKGNISMATCPADTNPPGNGGNSYGMSAQLTGIKATDYQNLPGATVVIGDCQSSVFNGLNELAPRHKIFRALRPQEYYQAITKDGDIVNNLSGG